MCILTFITTEVVIQFKVFYICMLWNIKMQAYQPEQYISMKCLYKIGIQVR
jgi:hypothetical protein